MSNSHTKKEEILISALSCLVESSSFNNEHNKGCDCQFCLDLASAIKILETIEQ